MLALILAMTATPAAIAPLPRSPTPVAALAEEPEISSGGVWLSLGKTVVITLTPTGLVAAPATALVEKNAHFSGNAVRFSFKRIGEKMVVLSVNNGYDGTLSYMAQIYLADGRNTRTSICPVLAGISSFESWGDPIVRIRLTNVQLSPKTAGSSQPMVCS